MQSEKSGYVLVFIMAATTEEAWKIANILAKERKAACVNIVPEVHSIFRWHGKMDSADEVLLIVKTREALLDELVGLIKENHSYEIPEVIALPVVGGNIDYLQWLDDETEKKIHVD